MGVSTSLMGLTLQQTTPLLNGMHLIALVYLSMSVNGRNRF